MDIPEKPATLVRQDTIQIQTKEKQHNMCCTPPCTRHNAKTKQNNKHNTICVGHHYMQISNHVNNVT